MPAAPITGEGIQWFPWQPRLHPQPIPHLRPTITPQPLYTATADKKSASTSGARTHSVLYQALGAVFSVHVGS